MNLSHRSIIASMADGIGELSFAGEDWVARAKTEMDICHSLHRAALGDVTFSLCEVAHNPPRYLDCGNKVSWHVIFENGRVSVASGLLDRADLIIEGDHSVLSNLARVQHTGRDPDIVSEAQTALQKLSRWKVTGSLPEHSGLRGLLQSFHDRMAEVTLPRFVWMSPEWVAIARHILTTRATSEKYRESLSEVDYTFAEEFHSAPRYASSPDENLGFWVKVSKGNLVVGSGPLPRALGEPDQLTFGDYRPTLPVGRTVNAAMSEDDQQSQAGYSKSAFQYDKESERPVIQQSSPSGKGPMPKELSRIFAPLHDELSKRTSGELPSDFSSDLPPAWSQSAGFDRKDDYSEGWLRYDKVNLYGEAIS